MNMKKAIFSLSSLSLLAMPAVGLAQAFDEEVIAPEPIATSFGDFVGIFNMLIGWLFTLLLIFSVIFIILAAFKYLTAGGDDEKIKSAHKMIIYAVVALVVAFLAQGIRFVVEELVSA